jgi:hypothetical protein
MRSLVDQLLEANIQVVLLTIFPVGETPVEKLVVWSDKTIEAVDRINELWRRTKRRGLVVVDCDKLLCQPQGRRIRAEFARDHLHVNQRGYALLNRDIEPILSSLGKEPRRAVQ